MRKHRTPQVSSVVSTCIAALLIGLPCRVEETPNLLVCLVCVVCLVWFMCGSCVIHVLSLGWSMKKIRGPAVRVESPCCFYFFLYFFCEACPLGTAWCFVMSVWYARVNVSVCFICPVRAYQECGDCGVFLRNMMKHYLSGILFVNEEWNIPGDNINRPSDVISNQPPT